MVTNSNISKFEHSVSVVKNGVVKYTCNSIDGNKNLLDYGGIMMAFNSKNDVTIGSTLYQYNGDKNQDQKG